MLKLELETNLVQNFKKIISCNKDWKSLHAISTAKRFSIWCLCNKLNQQTKKTYLLGFLLKLLNCSFVNTTTLVNQVTSCSRFPRVYMSNDNNVNMNLFLAHGD